jgi:nucleotide-binding universal stress UspA family protein
MHQYRTILFATDFSLGSQRACEHALTLAKLAGARLHVLHVITELSDKRRRRLPAEVVELFAKEVEIHAIEDMKEFCANCLSAEHGLEISTDLVIGRAVDEILKQATMQQADLIVLGSTGRTELEKILVGSTAERVVRHAKIPVLVVSI